MLGISRQALPEVTDLQAGMTARPGRIAECVEVGLPRPRSSEVKKSKKLLDYHNRFWDLLRHDELASRASAGNQEPSESDR